MGDVWQQRAQAYFEMLTNSNILRSLNELFWMWLASISPILFGALFIKLHHTDLGYFDILFRSIEVDIIFAYVATMISPFLFLLARAINSKYRKDIKSIKYGGICIFLSVSIILITAGIFSASKGDLQKENIAETVSIIGQVADLQHADIMVQKETTSELWDIINSIWDSLVFGNKLLAVCYFVALIIWYYSIYVNNAEPPNIVKEERSRVDDYMTDVGKVAEEEE